jgi:glycosyltransferase involved in cell wall biosynthesis
MGGTVPFGPLILFASYSGLLGGAERVLLDCATRLDRPVRIACPPGPLADAAGPLHVPLPAGPLRLGPRHAAALVRMSRALSALESDVLVAWGARAVIAAAPLRRRVLAVHHDLLRNPVRTIARAASRRAGAVAAASYAIADDLAIGAAVLHFGVDLDAFAPAPLPEGPPRALVLGALVGWKRPDLALAIARRMPELRVTFAGAPLPGEAFTLDAPPNVTFAGQVGDVNAALAQAHLLLHCADAEPYGLALVEALAAGRPVVAPAAGGPLEIVRDGAGRLYRPGDAGAAVEAIRAVLADPQAPAAARRRAEAAFDVEDSVRRLEALLAMLKATGNPARNASGGGRR